MLHSNCKCTCGECECCEGRKVVDRPPIRPYRCDECGQIDFYEVVDAIAPCLRPHCGCGDDMTFAGYLPGELEDKGPRSRRYEMLQEGHNWEQTGMLNPHAVPMRDTPQWTKYMAEGRIVKNADGHDCLLSKDHKQYVASLKDMGVHNAYGEGGETSKSRQQGEHLRHD